MAPRSTASRSANAFPNFPIGVRAPATMTEEAGTKPVYDQLRSDRDVLAVGVDDVARIGGDVVRTRTAAVAIGRRIRARQGVVAHSSAEPPGPSGNRERVISQAAENGTLSATHRQRVVAGVAMQARAGRSHRHRVVVGPGLDDLHPA